MENRKYRGQEGAASPGMVAGVIILGLGVLLLLQNLDIIYLHDIVRFWPMLLVAVGLTMCLDSQTTPGRLWGGLVIAAGLVLLARNLGYLPFTIRQLWPLALIGAGALLLWNAVGPGADPRPPGDREQDLRSWAVFSASKRRIMALDFRGGEALAIFGGCEIDLREAAIAGEQAVITTNAIFGGIELRVPRTWSVDLRAAGIFGGFDDKTAPPPPDQMPPAKRLVIRGSAIFGGVEIKN